MPLLVFGWQTLYASAYPGVKIDHMQLLVIFRRTYHSALVDVLGSRSITAAL